jgi:hypothetical protein
LVEKGLKPVIAVLDTAQDQAELDRLEVEHIARYRAEGFRLVNLSDGGGGRAGYITPEETKRKIASAHLGLKLPLHTSQWKARMSALMAGRRTNTPEHMARLAAMKRGVPRTEDVKAKISATKTGQPGTFKGHTHTEESRAKISESRTGQLLKNKHFAYRHDIQTSEILRLLESGMTKVQIATHFGTSPTFVHRRLNEARRDGLVVPKRSSVRSKQPEKQA